MERILHVYGSQGMGGDYSVRLEVQMKDVVDGETLQKAVENTSKRYPSNRRYRIAKMSL